MVEARVGQMDFSWIARADENWKKRREEREIKDTLADLDFNDSGSLTDTSRKLLQLGSPTAVAYALKLEDAGRARDKQKLDAENAKRFADINSRPLPGEGDTGIEPAPAVAAPVVRPAPAAPVGGGPLPAPPARPVQPTSRVWGDEEAVKAGIYPGPGETTETPPVRVAQAAPQIAPQQAPVAGPEAVERTPRERELLRELRISQSSMPFGTTPGQIAAAKARQDRIETELRSISDQRGEVRKSQLGEDVAVRAEERKKKGESYTKLRDQEDRAKHSLNITKAMEGIANSDDFIAGGTPAAFVAKAGQTISGLVGIARNYGIPVPDMSQLTTDASKIEAFNSLHQQLVKAQFSTLGAGVSNRDTGIVAEIFARTQNTVEGARNMLLLQRRTNEHTIAATKEVRAYRAANPRATQEQEDTHMEVWADKHPMLKEEDMKKLVGEKPKVEAPARREGAGGFQRALTGGRAAPAAPQGPPKGGEIIDGYRFKGGNPKDPKNWEPTS